MIKFIIATALLFAGSAMAQENVYLRANFGVENNKAPNSANPQNVSNNADYNRFALGYRFNRYFAVELGKMNNYQQTLTSSGQPYSYQYQDAYDLVGLGYIYKGLYAKAGVMSAQGTFNYTAMTVVGGVPTAVSRQQQYSTAYSPIFGIGYDYEVFKHMDINLEVAQAVNVAQSTYMSPMMISGGIKLKY